MARVVLASLAHADIAAILTHLAETAGYRVALRYDARFEQLFDRLEDFPDSGHPRPSLGADIRIGIVAPYLVVHRYTQADEVVTVLRVLHGRRRIAGIMLRGI